MAETKAEKVIASLRLLACGVTFCAAMVMLLAHQVAYFPDISMHVDFGDITPYWCLVFANFAACVYCLLVSSLNCCASKSSLWRLIVVLDVAMLVIVSSSCAAAMAVFWLEKNGNFHARWPPICPLVPSYCNRVFAATIVGFVGVLLFMALHVYSIQDAVNCFLIE